MSAQEELEKWVREHPGSDASWAPQNLREAAWREAGSPDYNEKVKNNEPGYQSSNPAIHYGMTEEEKSRFIPGKGSDLSELGLQKFAGGNPSASNLPSYSSFLSGGSGMAGNGAAGPWDPNDPNDPNAWMRFYDYTNPQNYMRGWQNIMEASGLNPEGNNPYVQWLSNPNLVAPLVNNWLVSRALGGQDWETPSAPYESLRSFLQSPLQSTIGSGLDTLGKLKDAVMAYLTPGSAAPSGPLGELANLLLDNDMAAQSILASVMARNAVPTMQQAYLKRVQDAYSRYMRQANPGTNSFAEWFFNNILK